MQQPNPLKPFFSILFGGLFFLLAGIGIFSLGTVVWNKVGINHSVSIISSADSASVETVISSLDKVTSITASAYIVKDLTTGSIITQKNSFQLLPVASLTKLVSAIIVHKNILDNVHITITKRVMQTYGNTANFKAGETFSAADLLYPLLMVSSNDAAEAYAQYYGRPQFIQAMNDFTQSIGAYRTYFADPSGLDPRNVSTAGDMALILDWIRTNDPSILATTELKTITIRNHTWVNPTHFLSWSYYIGGKNGYLPEADRTNASLFKWGHKGDIYAVVVLGSAERDADTIALLKRIDQ